MNTKQLEYFISVADNLSFTNTAEKFYISQTAVTQQIKALEEQINV
ncbi:LysR family transcriptional regulator, partial [Clostridioides difficile]